MAKAEKNVIRKKARGFAGSWGEDGVKGISFNEIYEVGYSEIMGSMAKTKYWAEGSEHLKYVVDHELGHQLDDLLLINKDKEVVSLFKGLKKENLLKAEVSGYAEENSKNINEFIAECWAEYRNNPTPRKPAKAIGDIIVKRYRDRYGQSNNKT